MQKNTLGRTNLKVSRYCLGSMTWGGPTPLEEAHQQIDTALDFGINFIDTAEIYPVTPVRAETVGRTERIIGLWFDQNTRRSDVIICTQHTGVGQTMVRGGRPIAPDTIRDGIEGALRRMRTDYIDLYNLHWPNRMTYNNRRRGAAAQPGQADAIRQDMADCLGALRDEVARGTIRHFGLSNETAWGMAQWLHLAEVSAGPRPAVIENEYSLLCRRFDADLAELSIYEGVPLMAYAPLAVGLLAGKYQGREKLPESRLTLMTDLGGRHTPAARRAVDDYLDVAFKHDLDIVALALNWVAERPFVGAVVFGATTHEQLKRILTQVDEPLSDEVLRDIETVHRAFPMPF